MLLELPVGVHRVGPGVEMDPPIASPTRMGSLRAWTACCTPSDDSQVHEEDIGRLLEGGGGQ